jgi:hypothetical protein
LSFFWIVGVTLWASGKMEAFSIDSRCLEGVFSGSCASVRRLKGIGLCLEGLP